MKIPGSISLIESRINEIETKIDRMANMASTPKVNFADILAEETAEISEKKEEMPNDVVSIIGQASKKYSLDKNLVELVAKQESNLSPNAVSKKGAMGVMQLMPATAKELGVQNPFDPEENINAGVKYLKTLINEFDGDLEKGLAAYNGGIGNVKKYGGIPPFKETKNYVEKILTEYNKQNKK